MEDISSIRKSSSTLLHQYSKHYKKIKDFNSMVSVNMTMHRCISLLGDCEMLFGGFCGLYATSVRSIWCVRVVPAHFGHDLARGVYLMTGQVSYNTNAAVLALYLLPTENEVPTLAMSSISSTALGNLGHLLFNCICDNPT